MKESDAALVKKIDVNMLPRHVAIIMDGNGRWAKKKMMPRIFGHRKGVASVDRVVTLASELGIKALTLYSFSAENWNRPRKEVDALMGILKEFLMKELNKMVSNNIRFNTIGRVHELPSSALDCIESVKEATKNNDGTILTLALSYGARNEIIDAVRAMGKKIKEGELLPEDITSDLMDKHLYTADIPEVDLLIRTSGELRISNFLLWQLAYAELYFTDVLWPDFAEKDFLEAIISYQKRERRFGLAGDQLPEKESAGQKPARLRSVSPAR